MTHLKRPCAGRGGSLRYMECCGEERSPGQDRCCLAISLQWGICKWVWGGPEDPYCPDTAGGSWRKSFSDTEAARDLVVHTERRWERGRKRSGKKIYIRNFIKKACFTFLLLTNCICFYKIMLKKLLNNIKNSKNLTAKHAYDNNSQVIHRNQLTNSNAAVFEVSALNDLFPWKHKALIAWD